MSTQSSNLIIRLIDGVSGPARGVNASLASINHAARRARQASFVSGAIGASLKQVAAVALAYKGAMGVKDSLEAEATEARLFTRIGLRAKASEAEIRKARDQVAEIAMQSGLAEEAVQQGLFTLAKGPRSLAAAMAILPDAAKVAQAYEIEVKQAAGTTAAMVNQLKIKPADVMAAWDGIASAAHAGRIQVNEFAEGLPGLMTQAALLGWTGTDGLKKIVSVAQMVAPAYATSQEALQSMHAVLEKMNNDRVVGRFKKMGIDVRAEMDKARASGKDVLETFYNLVLKATKGDMSIIGRLFPSGDFQKFFYALQQYKNKLDLQAKIKFDTGETKQAFDTIAKDAQSAIQNIKTAFGELSEDFGKLMMDAGAKWALDDIRKSINTLREAIQDAKDAGEYVFGGIHKRPTDEIAGMTSDERRAEIARADKWAKHYGTTVRGAEREFSALPSFMQWDARKALIQKQYQWRDEWSNYARYLRDQQERADRAEEIDRNMKQSMLRPENVGPPYGWGQSSKVPRGAPAFGAGASPLVGIEGDAMRMTGSFAAAGAQAGAAFRAGIASELDATSALLDQWRAGVSNKLRLQGSVDIKINAPNLNGQHSDAPNPRRQ